MRPPISLVKVRPSRTTKKVIAQLNEQEDSMAGVAVAVLMKGGGYWYTATGECRRKPEFTSGVLQLLNIKLLSHAKGQGDG